MINFSKILITAALPYINAIPHLGNLVGSVLPADVFARYHRIRENNVLYICGSDTHGTPIEVAAFKAGVSPEELATKNHQLFQEIFKNFNIQFDYYGNTHSDTNKRYTYHFFRKLKENGHLTTEEQEIFYCEKDKAFRADRWVEGKCPKCGGLSRGDQCNVCGELVEAEELKDPYCVVCKGPVELKKTEHFLFKLSDFENSLEKWIKNQTQWPQNVKNYSLSWIREGLHNRSITRDIRWGFSVPEKGFEDKVFYVWFDAPIGYISFVDEYFKGDARQLIEWWKRNDTKLYQFLGKDNITFHTTWFPAMLMGCDENWILPHYIAGTEFLNAKGVKFSKSQGVGLNAITALDIRPADYWRYTLMALYPDTKDSEFSLEEFQRRVNTELNDIFGNFVLRTLTLIQNKYDGKIPERNTLTDKDKEILAKLEIYVNDISALYEKVQLREAVKRTVELGKEINSYINSKEPWKEEDPSTTLNICANLIHAIGLLLYPVIPESSEKILRSIGINQIKWNSIGKLVKAGNAIEKPSQLFTKIDDKELNDLKKRLETPISGGKPMIEISDFQKVDLRVGKVVSAEKIEGSSKLLKLQIDAGDEKRQIVSGIAQFYDPEELIGQEIVFIANLKPATIKGVESQGMILAAEDKDGEVSLVKPDKTMQPGSGIK